MAQDYLADAQQRLDVGDERRALRAFEQACYNPWLFPGGHAEVVRRGAEMRPRVKGKYGVKWDDLLARVEASTPAQGEARPEPTPVIAIERIEILAGKPGRPYKVLRNVHARASAPTAFNRAPTLDEVNGKLRE